MRPAPAVAAGPPRPRAASRHTASPAAARLARLHLASRGVPAVLTALAACAVALRAVLHWHWLVAGSPSAALGVPLVIEAAAAAVIALSTRGPFGEPERATGRWLPWLRLLTAAGLTAAAIGLLAAAAAGARLPGGDLDVLRNVAGLAGVGLLTSAVTGGALAWAGPGAYLVLAEGALAGGWTTPWAWPARPPHDVGGALCAGLACAAGLTVIAVRGSRDRIGDG